MTEYKCTCDEEFEEHTCPYQEDINGDYDSLCTCCPCCQDNCAMDI